TPFTIQRLCELITEPKKYYKTTDKFLRGVEKNIMVVSTVQPDGSLITRSISTPLTNGDLSPTKTNTESQNLTPLNNSPLNTITQDQSAITATTAEVTSEEKTESQAIEQNSVDSNTSINITQGNESEQEQSHVARDIVQCSDNGENVLKVDENSEHTSATDNVQNCKENGTTDNDAIEKEEIVTKSETPTGQLKRL
ncbi:serine threonine- phosphatase 4 regulatory subunit 2-A-like, partial [Paramuricea clavata]